MIFVCHEDDPDDNRPAAFAGVDGDLQGIRKNEKRGLKARFGRSVGCMVCEKAERHGFPRRNPSFGGYDDDPPSLRVLVTLSDARRVFYRGDVRSFPLPSHPDLDTIPF